MAGEYGICFASVIPLRGQLLILLGICAVIFLIVAPVVIYNFRNMLGISFEEDFLASSINKYFATSERIFYHENIMMVADAVWDAMADSADELILHNRTEYFRDFIVTNLFQHGIWSDWACGSMLAVYDRQTESDTPVLKWGEFHAINLDTLEMYREINETPSMFRGETEESKAFLRKAVTHNSSLGVIAIDEGLFSVTCHAITHVADKDCHHGYFCRITDIRRYMVELSSGSGSCLTLYNLVVSDFNSSRTKYAAIPKGKAESGSKYKGAYVIESVETKKWAPPAFPIRFCGPAEMPKANSAKRSLVAFHLESDFGVDNGRDTNFSGYAVVLDTPEELKPMVTDLFAYMPILVVCLGLVLFIVYALFTEFKILREVNAIAKVAYKSFIENNEEYYKNKAHSKNEIIQMATLAAANIKQNMKEIESRTNELGAEKMQSSVVADQLRLLSLHCARSSSFDVMFGGELVLDEKDKAKLRRKGGVIVGDGQVIKESISFDRVLNDPFSIEMFKSFTVEDPQTGVVTFPARKSLLFILSVLYYRSLFDSQSSVKSRLECIQGILDEFLTASDPVNTSDMSGYREDPLGLSDALSTKLILDASMCMSTRRPKKELFDDAASNVREYLRKNVYPKFMKSPAFLIVRIVFAEKSKMRENVDFELDIPKYEPSSSDMAKRYGMHDDASSLTGASVASKSDRTKMRDIVNISEGTLLSHRAFSYVTATVFE